MKKMMLLALALLFSAAVAQDTDGMRGSVQYWIDDTEATIDSLEAAGEIPDVINCYNTILNVLHVIEGQLDAIDMLREEGPPE